MSFDDRQRTYYTQELNRALPSLSASANGDVLRAALENVDGTIHPRNFIGEALRMRGVAGGMSTTLTHRHPPHTDHATDR
jgi:hypothetical protein